MLDHISDSDKPFVCHTMPMNVAYFIACFQDIVEAKEYLEQRGVDVSTS